MRQSVNAKASLTARLTGRAVTKVGVSDPAVCEWKTPRERKGIRWLNCETDMSSRNESWS